MAEAQAPPSDADRTLLIVEDNDRFAETLGSEFRDRGYRVTRAHDLASLDALPDPGFDYAVVDLRLGADSGLDAIQRILARAPAARVVVLTGYGSIATAVKATKLGAVGYLMKPTDAEQVERALLEEDDDEGRAVDPRRVPEPLPPRARVHRVRARGVRREHLAGGAAARAASAVAPAQAPQVHAAVEDARPAPLRRPPAPPALAPDPKLELEGRRDGLQRIGLLQDHPRPPQLDDALVFPRPELLVHALARRPDQVGQVLLRHPDLDRPAHDRPESRHPSSSGLCTSSSKTRAVGRGSTGRS